VPSVPNDHHDPFLQAAAGHFVKRTRYRTFVNKQKTKMLICFHTKTDLANHVKIKINDKDLEYIQTFKLLGLSIFND
jgi:phosphomevalonate kinase